MNCLKCGTETRDSQVFCPSCLTSMEHYPVKPGTAVHLPHSEETAPVKKPAPRRKTLSPEDQLLFLKKLVRRMAVALAVLCAVLALTVGMLIHNMLQEPDTAAVGRNYTTVDPAAP